MKRTLKPRAHSLNQCTKWPGLAFQFLDLMLGIYGKWGDPDQAALCAIASLCVNAIRYLFTRHQWICSKELRKRKSILFIGIICLLPYANGLLLVYLKNNEAAISLLIFWYVLYEKSIFFILFYSVLAFVTYFPLHGWMTCYFTSFSTVFQSYQDNEMLITKGCVQWNPVYGWEEFASSWARTRDR